MNIKKGKSRGLQKDWGSNLVVESLLNKARPWVQFLAHKEKGGAQNIENTDYPLIFNYFLKIKLSQGWRDSSAVKSTDNSSKGPGRISTHMAANSCL